MDIDDGIGDMDVDRGDRGWKDRGRVSVWHEY